MGAKKAKRSGGTGTWTDRAAPGDRELIARGRQLELAAQQADIDARSAARRHFLRMQAGVLIGVGSLILLTVATLVVSLSMKAINSGFATELARIVLPILLGALATIVGAYFGAGTSRNGDASGGSGEHGRRGSSGRRRKGDGLKTRSRRHGKRH